MISGKLKKKMKQNTSHMKRTFLNGNNSKQQQKKTTKTKKTSTFWKNEEKHKIIKENKKKCINVIFTSFIGFTWIYF